MRACVCGPKVFKKFWDFSNNTGLFPSLVYQYCLYAFLKTCFRWKTHFSVQKWNSIINNFSRLHVIWISTIFMEFSKGVSSLKICLSLRLFVWNYFQFGRKINKNNISRSTYFPSRLNCIQLCGSPVRLYVRDYYITVSSKKFVQSYLRHTNRLCTAHKSLFLFSIHALDLHTHTLRWPCTAYSYDSIQLSCSWHASTPTFNFKLVYSSSQPLSTHMVHMSEQIPVLPTESINIFYIMPTVRLTSSVLRKTIQVTKYTLRKLLDSIISCLSLIHHHTPFLRLTRHR